MPKRKSASSNNSKAKKIAKVSKKKSEKKTHESDSVISNIVNAGLSNVSDHEEYEEQIDIVEKSPVREASDKEDEKSFEKPSPPVGEAKDSTSEESINVILSGERDDSQESSDSDIPTPKKHPRSPQSRNISPKKTPRSPVTVTDSDRIKYEAAFISEKRLPPLDTNRGAAFSHDPSRNRQRTRDMPERRHVFVPPVTGAPQALRPMPPNNQPMRGGAGPHRGRFPPHGNNQPIYPPGMEYPPFFPMHPQFPGQPPYPPMYPFPPDARFPPQPPQYGPPADGHVDPAWYFANQHLSQPQNFRGNGRGQPPFPRGGVGRGRIDFPGNPGMPYLLPPPHFPLQDFGQNDQPGNRGDNRAERGMYSGGSGYSNFPPRGGHDRDRDRDFPRDQRESRGNFRPDRGNYRGERGYPNFSRGRDRDGDRGFDRDRNHDGENFHPQNFRQY
mmetsp:Transcript_16782/g.26112  ORF Transcript_16782/g.26112 Transcript_16782/m.26112 type:complete len:443 (+) Transcript_16782:28-1356(+)